jgi:hypothetical protein
MTFGSTRFDWQQARYRRCRTAPRAIRQKIEAQLPLPVTVIGKAFFDIGHAFRIFKIEFSDLKSRAPADSASPLAEIAIGFVRLDYSAEVVQHADVCRVRARERPVLRIRDGVTDRVWPCIPDRAVSKPIAD